MSPTSKVGCQSEEGGSLNLTPPARFVEMLTNEIIFSDEKIIRIYGILKKRLRLSVNRSHFLLAFTTAFFAL